MIRTETYDVVVIDNCEYLQSKDYSKFRLAASGAFNYPFDEDEEEQEEHIRVLKTLQEDIKEKK